MTNGEKIKEIFPYLTKQMLADNINIFEWWSAEYKEPTIKNDLGVDCIDRKELIDWINIWDITPIIKKPLIRHVQGMPSVTPQEPRKGQWIEHFDESGKWCECDQCHTDWGGAVNFCPNCGADMRGVKE